jgi:glutamine synthetase
VLNTIVAEAIDSLAEDVEGKVHGGASLEEAVLAAVKDAWSANKQIVFDGDNYSDDWHAEAEQRGLANLKQTPDALPWLLEDQTVTLFSNYGVLSQRELESRYEVSLEQYATKINIEAETAASIARTMILPAALEYLALLDQTGVERLKAEATELVDSFVEAIFALEEANLHHGNGDVLGHAKYMQGTVLPAMEAVREVADRLERVVPDQSWPLPKYSEILFIK